MNNNFQESFDTKKIVFFAFYIVFFIFVFVLLKNGINSNKNELYTRNNSGYNKTFNLNKISKNNYKYVYKINKDGESIIIEGSKFDNKEEFVVSGDEPKYYYIEDNECYLKNKNSLKYEKAIIPYDIMNMLNINILKNVFIHGTYISRTYYLSGKEVDYNYEISTNSLLKYVNNINNDYESAVNKVTAKVDEDNNMYEVFLDLTSYYKFKDKNINNYNMIATFSKFGEVSDIDIANRY